GRLALKFFGHVLADTNHIRKITLGINLYFLHRQMIRQSGTAFMSRSLFASVSDLFFGSRFLLLFFLGSRFKRQGYLRGVSFETFALLPELHAFKHFHLGFQVISFLGQMSDLFIALTDDQIPLGNSSSLTFQKSNQFRFRKGCQGHFHCPKIRKRGPVSKKKCAFLVLFRPFLSAQICGENAASQPGSLPPSTPARSRSEPRPTAGFWARQTNLVPSVCSTRQSRRVPNAAVSCVCPGDSETQILLPR